MKVGNRQHKKTRGRRVEAYKGTFNKDSEKKSLFFINDRLSYSTLANTELPSSRKHFSKAEKGQKNNSGAREPEFRA